MKKITLSIKTFIFLILFILPCVSVASEKLAPAGSKQGPEIFVQLGHTNLVNSVAFSPDGRYALSGSDDNTMKLWEITAHTYLRGRNEKIK